MASDLPDTPTVAYHWGGLSGLACAQEFQTGLDAHSI
jgi:hypothetical protein